MKLPAATRAQRFLDVFARRPTNVDIDMPYANAWYTSDVQIIQFTPSIPITS